MELGRKDSSPLFETIINRLEICFKKIAAAIDEHKNSKKQISSSNFTSGPIRSSQKKQVERLPKEKAEKQKTVDLDNLDLKKSFSDMTEEQKDQLRSRILKQKPKPPMNAFIAYVKAQKDRIKNCSTKNLSIAQITAIASEEWKSLEQQDKLPYLTVYNLQHAEYTQKMDQFLKQNPILKKLKLKKSGGRKPLNKFIISKAPVLQKVKQDSSEDESEQDIDSLSDQSEVMSQVKNSAFESPVFTVVQVPKNTVQKEESKKIRQQIAQDRIRIQSYEERIDPEAGLKKIKSTPSQYESKFLHVKFGARPQQKQMLKNEAKEKILDSLKAKKAQKMLNQSHENDQQSKS